MSLLNRIFNRGAEPAPKPTTQSTGRGVSVKSFPTGGASLDGEEPAELREHLIKRTPRLFEQFPRIPASKAIWRKIAAACDLSKERAELAAICAEWPALLAFQLAHCRDEAVAAWERQSADLKKKIEAGDFKSISDSDTKSRQDFVADFKRKSENAYAQMCARSTAAAPVCEAIASKLAKSANALAIRLEKDERAVAESFEVPFRPSAQLICIGQCSWNVKSIVPVPGTSDSPQALLDLISAE